MKNSEITQEVIDTELSKYATIVGFNYRRLLYQHKMTYRDVNNRVSIPATSSSHIVHGKGRNMKGGNLNPSLTTLIRIAKVFDVTVQELLSIPVSKGYENWTKPKIITTGTNEAGEMVVTTSIGETLKKGDIFILNGIHIYVNKEIKGRYICKPVFLRMKVDRVSFPTEVTVIYRSR